MAAGELHDLHLAQFNIAVLRHPIGHPATAGFEALIDETNRWAEASDGFVWRHGIDARDVGTIAYDDPLVTVNASVWRSPSHLRDFAYRGFHRDVFRRRDEWFVDSAAVLWWLPSGTVPTLDECKLRLAFHEAHGSTPYVFGMGERVPVLAVHRRRSGASGSLRAELDGAVVATAEWSVADGTMTAEARVSTDDPWLPLALADALTCDALADACTHLVVAMLGIDRPVTPLRHRETRPSTMRG